MHEGEQRNGSFNFWYFSPLALAYLVRLSRTLQSWTKLTENLDPPPLMGKWCVFAFVRLHPWFWGDNYLLFLNIPPKIAPPPPKKNQGWENIARFGLRAASSLIILGNGSLLFHFFDPQNPNHFTLTVFAGSKFVKERWCACLLHLYHNTTGKWRASSLGPKIFFLFTTWKTGQQSLISVFIG